MRGVRAAAIPITSAANAGTSSHHCSIMRVYASGTRFVATCAKPLKPPCSAPRRWSGLFDAASRSSSAQTVSAARPSAGTRKRHPVPDDATASTANATPMTIAPPPSEPSWFSAIVTSESSATAMNAGQP